MSLSKSIEELKGDEKQIELEEFALQVFVNMVEEGEKNFQKPLRNIQSLKQNVNNVIIMQHTTLFEMLIWCDKFTEWQLEKA